VQALDTFLAAAQAQDWREAARQQERVAQLESDADRLKQQVRRNLPKRLWMPVARTDLLDLVTAQDKLANRSQDIAGLMLGRQMSFPRKLDKGLRQFMALSINAAGAAVDALDATHMLFRSGFGARQAREVERIIEEVERIERRSDKQQLKLRARLYRLEEALSPVDAMFLYQVITWIGDIADQAEKVAHRLLLIIKS
jgi:predicted phosphate transport protein (TIGR00153 family)